MKPVRRILDGKVFRIKGVLHGVSGEGQTAAAGLRGEGGGLLCV